MISRLRRGSKPQSHSSVLGSQQSDRIAGEITASAHARHDLTAARNNRFVNVVIRFVASALALLFVAHFALVQAARAQSISDTRASTTPRIHYQFPFQTMWDDAVLTSVNTGKPTVAFDLDLIDSASIRLANVVLSDKRLQAFLRSHFEPAMNDFATDPPPTVGLDSLRNLGWRLSGLEKDYGIAKRPCVIVIGSDKQEIDRIVFPAMLSARQLETRLDDILGGRNTLQSVIAKFWSDTSNVALRWQLIDLFEERSKFDSVVRHLDGIRLDATHPADARRAWTREADLRLNVQGTTTLIESLMASLGTHGADSDLHYSLLVEVLDHYKKRKKADSVAATYERIMSFLGTRDPDLLNEEAWYLASNSSESERAIALVNEAIAARPKSPDFLDTRALAESNLQKFDEAIEDEKAAFKVAPKKDKSYFNSQIRRYKDLKKKSLDEQKEDTTHPKH
jgi:tetratricopeptide (TPR) repeat protein